MWNAFSLTPKAHYLILLFCSFVYLNSSAEDKVNKNIFNQDSLNKYSIKLNYARKIITKNDTLYSVSYSFNFSDRKDIYIIELGSVPSEGQYSYLTTKDYIEFRDSYNGNIIGLLPFGKPTVIMGTEDLRMPRPSGFPKEYREYHWSKNEVFQNRLFIVLNDKFTNYYAIASDGMNSIVTSYDLIPNTEKVLIRVALMFSCPVDANSRDSHYQIRFLAQERRSHSDWRDNINDESLTIIRTFLSTIIKKIEEP